MIIPRVRGFRWKMGARLLVRLIFFTTVATARATGYSGPTSYLDEGGRRVIESPEFYWALELRRLASAFHPPEKFLRDQKTAEVDLADFEAALREGRLHPANPAEASAQHAAARAAIDGGQNLPAEFASEFADYHRGAAAPNFVEARRAWEQLLARPAEERRNRSVWAAFMIGKRLLLEKNPEAVIWFQRTRQLAREGFKDSLGMAADSYGWEARSEWKQGHPEKAAPLYLMQLALGDESALVSLKALIPDRAPVEGMLNYGPQQQELYEDDDPISETDAANLNALEKAARDPLLRRLMTVHILATQNGSPYDSNQNQNKARGERWLRSIEQARLGKIADAEYLGWVAYSNGSYEQAARWLSMSDGETPAALWLKAKLLRRAGKLDEAVRVMARAWETLRSTDAYTGLESSDEEEEGNDWMVRYDDRWEFPASASGDLGGLRLARSEFVGALDAFAQAKMWNDAAYLAERVLTLEELKKYVDAQPSDAPNRLPYLLGRRLVRQKRYADALPYLPTEQAERLRTYVAALQKGADARLPKMERARAYFSAAWIARYDGMEIMGTDGAPDGFLSEGNFPEPELAKQRLSGSYLRMSYDANGEHGTKLPIALSSSAQEKARLSKQRIEPDARFHYRVIAAEHALRAAELLPENSDALADILNYAGRWAGERDPKLADRCFGLLQRRAAETAIGKAARAQRWFVDLAGPWSAEEEAARPQKEQPQ